MSDTSKSLDLETAQRMYIAAGQPEQAKAAGFVIDAVRNTVQGEWGQSFVGSLERLLVLHITPLAEQLGGLRDGQNALQAEFRAGQASMAAAVSTLAETVDGLQTQMIDSQEDRRFIHEEVAGVKSDVAEIDTKLAALETKLDAYIAGSKREQLEDLRREVEILKQARS